MTKENSIHVYATEPHFLDHLKPVHNALPDTLRGDIYTTTPPPPHTQVLVASANDLAATRGRNTVIFFEHGCGMTWGRKGNGSYPDTRRRGANLVVAPNERVANLQQQWTPTINIGSSPRLDQYVNLDTTGRTEIAVSFHWDCRIVPETRSAFKHYEKVLPVLAERHKLLGHAHPRIWKTLRPFYEQHNIEIVESFDEIMRRAALYICDVSSTLYEFATLDLPVVCLNAPWYRRNVKHGLRFWELIPGAQVDDPTDLPDIVEQALLDPPEWAWARRRAVNTVYPRNDGNASHRAVQQLLTLQPVLLRR